jgi:putative tricarboxylic transport membrane protein
MTTDGLSPQRRPDGAALVIALILATLGAVIIWQTLGMRVAPNYARVGPTTFPYIVAGGLLLLAVGTVISAVRGSFPARERDRIAPMAWIVGGLVLQMLTMGTVGFSIATGILFAMTAKGFGRGPVWLSLIIGVVFSFCIWFAFAKGLQLSLPRGPLENLVP